MKKRTEKLNMHEGLSINQVGIILHKLHLKPEVFFKWLDGQTCPMVPRYDARGRIVVVTGVYEYDLFRWILNKTNGLPLIWD